jgi:RNA polymerase sigma factor (sigma-70 family)
MLDKLQVTERRLTGICHMPKIESINALFLSCRAMLARSVSGIVPPHEIEDIVQETYVRACRLSPRSEITLSHALMITIARNLAFDHIKSSAYRLNSALDPDAATNMANAANLPDETFRQVTSDEEFSKFCRILRQLPLQCRRAFVLRKVYGCSQSEIAKVMGISESTVEKHIVKGFKFCTQHMISPAQNSGSSTSHDKQARNLHGGSQ